MGCVFSSTSAAETNNKPTTSSVGGVHFPNWTFPKSFKLEPAPTTTELRKKREEFWDTSPSYGGSREIWEVLRAAVTCGNIDTARVFVESAGIIVATPHLTCVFDERGGKYDIPLWVLTTPSNLVPEPMDDEPI